MSVLATEDSKVLTTEDGKGLLIEPVVISLTPNIQGAPGRQADWVAWHSDVGIFVETSRGRLKMNDKNQLLQEAKNSGARVRFL